MHISALFPVMINSFLFLVIIPSPWPECHTQPSPRPCLLTLQGQLRCLLLQEVSLTFLYASIEPGTYLHYSSHHIIFYLFLCLPPLGDFNLSTVSLWCYARNRARSLNILLSNYIYITTQFTPLTHSSLYLSVTTHCQDSKEIMLWPSVSCSSQPSEPAQPDQQLIIIN